MPDYTLVEPPVTRWEGIPLIEKLRAIEFYEKQKYRLVLTVTQNDNIVDLSQLPSGTWKFRFQEGSRLLKKVYEANAAIYNAQTGRIIIENGEILTQIPGLYRGNYFYVEAATGNILLTNPFHFIVVPSLAAASNLDDYAFVGPPSSKEIELHLKSSSAHESTLLAQKEIDIADIWFCLLAPVEIWNTTPPAVAPLTTTNFPFRQQWIEATIGELLIAVAHQYRRDHLPLQSAGIAIDDKNKFVQYDQAGMLRRQAYLRFVRHKKLQIDTEGAFGFFPSRVI